VRAAEGVNTNGSALHGSLHGLRGSSGPELELLRVSPRLFQIANTVGVVGGPPLHHLCPPTLGFIRIVPVLFNVTDAICHLPPEHEFGLEAVVS